MIYARSHRISHVHSKEVWLVQPSSPGVVEGPEGLILEHIDLLGLRWSSNVLTELPEPELP